ncbi:MAG TPA: BON domain-containing protein [Gaiellaceae bacterium]|nr:BON domain-containing protein [Gaiellaceae bacterium]
MKKLLPLAAIAAALAFLRSARGKVAIGRLRGVASGAGAPDYNDQTLKAKVETELFRDPDAPKGTVDVNAQNGVIQLRGEVESPELIEELVAQARSIQGVRDVENLLHTPGAPAPMHE